MNQDGPVWPALPRRGPQRDKRSRERERERERERAQPPGDRTPPHNAHSKRPASPAAPEEAPSPPSDRRRDELRLFGLNACLAAFAARPQDLRKAWISPAHLPRLRALMAWCVRHRIGYRVVEDEDLARLSGSQHHEGLCLDMLRPKAPTLETLLAKLPSGRRSCLLWLDGVGNPHNLGAVLRSAAHFSVDAVLLPPDSPLALSGAACRVAEGGAEAVPLLHLSDTETALANLKAAGFSLAATVPRNGDSLFDRRLPERTVLLLGAERDGMQAGLIERCDLRLSIPGSGQVESLNIASAVAVLLTWMFHGRP